MKRIEWRKISLLIIAIALSMSGCQQKENASEEKAAATEAPADVWNEKWTVALDSGESIPAEMKCEIDAMENQPDSIVDAQSLEINSQNKEALAKGAFGGEVYLFDAENMCEADLQKRLIREGMVLQKGYKRLEYLQKNHVDIVSDYRKKTITELKGRVNKVKELLKTAPTEPVAAQDGEYTSDSYMGYIDGTAYRLEFIPHTHGNKAYEVFDDTWWQYWNTYNASDYNIELFPLDIKSFAPEELKDAWEINSDDFYKDYNIVLNACSLSEEEAEEKAVDILKRLGFTNMAKVAVEALGWREVDVNDDMGNAVIDGYVFHFQTEVGGNVLNVLEDEIDYDLPYGKEEVQVQVNDKGVVKVAINAPIQVDSITPDVELLELKDVKDMLRTQLPAYIPIYREEYEKQVDEKVSVSDFKGTYLQLMYGRIIDPENPLHFTYVPVWELTGYFDRVKLVKFYMNAIDGSYVTLDFQQLLH